MLENSTFKEINVVINRPKFKLIQFTHYMQKSTHR